MIITETNCMVLPEFARAEGDQRCLVARYMTSRTTKKTSNLNFCPHIFLPFLPRLNLFLTALSICFINAGCQHTCFAAPSPTVQHTINCVPYNKQSLNCTTPSLR